MEPSWKHADVFPIIARVFDQAYREHQRFITAQEIAARLLQDSEGRNLVEAAREQQQDQQQGERTNNVKIGKNQLKQDKKDTCNFQCF